MRQYEESRRSDPEAELIGPGLGDVSYGSRREEGPEEIRVEIEQTRTEMSGTIDAIQDKLDPQVLTEQAKDAVQDVADHAIQEIKDAALEVTGHAVQEAKDAAREMTGQAKEAAWDATIGRAEDAVTSAGQTARGVGSIVIETIKQNPVPAALAGLSLGWLFMNRSSGPPRRGAYPAYQAGVPSASYPAYSAGRTAASYPTGQPYQESGRSTVGEMADKAGEVATRAQERAGQAVSSAGELAGEALDSAGELASTAGDRAVGTGSAILETIKQNPVPAALIGVGLGWLLMNGSSGGRPPHRARSGDHYWRGSSGQGAQQSDGGVGATARQAQEQAGELVSEAQHQAGELADTALHQAQQAQGRVQQMAHDNPLMAGAVALAVGSAVGFALPETSWEDRFMGKTRDNLMGRAQSVTEDAVQKAQRVAEEVQNVAKTEAREQGLTV
jgi:ElaB/YqjD/DUF883 family membrane-anchored ribosome-binding protein